MKLVKFQANISPGGMWHRGHSSSVARPLTSKGHSPHNFMLKLEGFTSSSEL